MTATFVGAMVPRLASGDAIARIANVNPYNAPGTLWERVAEQRAVYRSPRPYSEVDKVQLAARIVRVEDTTPRENIPQRVERIACDHNISRREALRVALSESRLERAKAAHPAGKGRAND